MKAILLAAGRGTRISEKIGDGPNCTLPVMGQPLIRRSVEILQARNIKVAVCIGYQYQMVKDALSGLSVVYYYNPFFGVTNSIASLWLARDFIDEDCLFINADVYLTEEILDGVIRDINDVVMSIDKSRKSVGDYFLQTSSDGCIKKYGKDLPLEDRSGEYVGLAKIHYQFISEFCKRMEQFVENGEYDKWWENVLYSFIDKFNVHTLDVNRAFWAEVDYYNDYERILSFASSKKDAIEI